MVVGGHANYEVSSNNSDSDGTGSRFSTIITKREQQEAMHNCNYARDDDFRTRPLLLLHSDRPNDMTE